MNSKIKTAGAIAKTVKALKSKNKKIIFTNGCFDILHVGHIEYLNLAKRMGDILVIGLNSDESVRRLKGAGRPINSETDRAKVLAALDFVDYVVVFGKDTPEKLIKKIRPDVLVKGADWNVGDIVGSAFVKSHGGKVRTVPFVKGYSTTSLIKKMKR